MIYGCTLWKYVFNLAPETWIKWYCQHKYPLLSNIFLLWRVEHLHGSSEKKNNKKKCCIVVFPIASNFSLALHLAISWGSREIVLHIVVTYWLTHTGLDSQLVTYSCWMTGLGHCLAKKLSQPYHLFLDYWTCLQSSDIRQPGSVPSSASVLNERPRSVSRIQKCWEIL